MGDGLLAIFPVKRGSGWAMAGAQGENLLRASAGAASSAIGQARAALSQARPEIGFRSALHVGRFSYGNMGASRRLDFTAIGPAVNLASRLLEAASRLGRDDVMSAEAARLLGAGEMVASLPLKGFAGEHEIWAASYG